MKWAVRIRCGNCGERVWFIPPEGNHGTRSARQSAVCRNTDCGTFIAWDPTDQAAAMAEWLRTGKSQTIHTFGARRR